MAQTQPDRPANNTGKQASRSANARKARQHRQSTETGSDRNSSARDKAASRESAASRDKAAAGNPVAERSTDRKAAQKKSAASDSAAQRSSKRKSGQKHAAAESDRSGRQTDERKKSASRGSAAGHSSDRKSSRNRSSSGDAAARSNASGHTAARQPAQKRFLEQPQPGYFVSTVSQTDSGQEKTYQLTKAQRAARRRRIAEMKRRRRNRRIIGGIIFVLILLLAFLVIKHFTGDGALVPSDELDVADLDEDNDEETEKDWDGDPVATILFAGDISTSADQVEAVTRSDSTYDFASAFSQVSSYITNSDFAVADFETCLVDGENYGTAPYYNSPVQLAGTLRSMGFRLMSTANTYALNNGIEGINSTIDNLTTARLKHVGTYKSQEERDKNGGAYIRYIHGIKFAFLSYTKGTDSVTLPDECGYALNTLYTDYADYWSDLRTSQIESDVQAAKDAGAEVIIALVHWGSEYSRSVTTTQDEVAELLLSNGVDVIIGTHSHVVSEMGFQTVTQTDDTEKECFVAYGIGDFYTDPEQDSAYTSLLLNLTFTRNDDNSISIVPTYIPIYMYVSQEDDRRSFQVLDTYHELAELYRQETLDSADSMLFNALLDSIDTLHNYAGSDYDVGLQDDDEDDVKAAIERGAISDDVIKLLQDEEEAAAEEAAEAAAKASEEAAAAAAEAEGTGEDNTAADGTAATDGTETDTAAADGTTDTAAAQ